MAKKDNTIKKEKIKEVEEEIDSLEFEEYDDEDDTKEAPFNKEKERKERITMKKEKVERKTNKSILGECKEYISIASLIIGIITLILSIIILVKVNNLNGTTKKGSTGSGESADTSDYDTSMFKEIDVDKFIEMFENENRYYFVYTGRPTCSYCRMMIGNYQKSVKEYDYDLYYYDTQSVTSEIVEKIKGLDDTFEKDFPATPMVYLVGKGEVKAVSEGYTEYETYAKFLENNGVDKK